MSNKLQPFYNAFGGLDTRQNKLVSNPKTQRRGSKNFRYNFQDELQQANGWQHKDDDSGASKRGLIEYKFKDINTGASKTQILGVGDDGNLRKKVFHAIKFSAIGAGTGYSFYYDEVNLTFVFEVIGVGSVNVSTAMTMAQLSTALNLLAGVTTTVVDQDGTLVVGSTKLAYLGNVVINERVNINSIVQESWYWSQIYYGGTGAPFPTTVLYVANPDSYPNYEGISYTNLNNSVYITDGGFPMKYDGYSVYRAGMPRWTLDLGGARTTLPTHAGGDLTANSNYRYIFQNCFVDANGLEISGKINYPDSIFVALAGGLNSISFGVNIIGNSDISENTGFPVYDCRVDGNQTLAGTGSKTLNVSINHNIQAGMCLRVPQMNSANGITTSFGLSWSYYLVTSVTATTITFNKTQSDQYFPSTTVGYQMEITNVASAANLFLNDLIINACYVPDYLVGKTTEPNYYYSDEKIQCWSPTPIYGAFCRVWRTTANGETFYKVTELPVSHNYFYAVRDRLGDNTISVLDNEVPNQTTIDADFELGEELPRACKYLSSWYDQLVQAGRPVDTDRIVSAKYPYYYGTPPTTGTKWGGTIVNAPWYYSEADLCDFQSIYWATSSSPEGFSRSGLTEESLDTVFNDEIKGIYPNKDAFFIFKNRSFGYLTGTLADGNLNKEVVEADFGCANHRSIQEVGGALIWLDQVNGFVSCVAGRLPYQIGYPILDEVKINPDKLDFSKACAANFRFENIYVCCVEDAMFVFDYADTNQGQGKRAAWYYWNHFDCTSILATADDQLLVGSGNRLWRFKRTNTKYDMSNHTSAIDFEVRSAWINFGLPTIDKSYLGAWINSIQGDFDLEVTSYVNYLDELVSDQDVTFPVESATKMTVKLNVKNSTAKVSAISLGMKNSEVNQFVRIQGYDLQFAADFDTGEPKK